MVAAAKTLIVTEKKSVADDFARVLGGFARKGELAYEREDLVLSWASGHLLELQDPSAYDKKYKRWSLGDLPILPDRFVRAPREQSGRAKDLLKHLVRQIQRPDVGTIVNACDAGREGELIFNLILDHARDGGGVQSKKVRRLWLQSMTAPAIRAAFASIRDAREFRHLRDAAYSRDEADWLVGMNGTRAFTRKFMGRARQFFAVGRVKTPTLAFLVDREREIDAFVPEPYFQIDATFDTGSGTYTGRWTGQDEAGRRADRLRTRARAEDILKRVGLHPGQAQERHSAKSEIPPLLYDLTSLQREASSRFGYTLDRTLSIAQSLYEARKAITYPRTSSRYLPTDYGAEIPKLVQALQRGELGPAAARAVAEAGGIERLQPAVRSRVFNDAKVSDHFALIPTEEVPRQLKEDERRIYELIVRRFLAVFLPAAEWDLVTRETVVLGEIFLTRERRLRRAGWRAVEPPPDHKDLAPLPKDGRVATLAVEILEKETQPPARYSDGTLVKAMETAGREIPAPEGEEEEALDDEALEALKEKGIGTPATRAAIVKDLITKGLARRTGRTILPTPLGCTLVRLVRNLDLGVLAKPDLTGTWEYRLAQMADGRYSRADWTRATREMVEEIVRSVRDYEGGNEDIFSVDHPKRPLPCPACKTPLQEKTFSYLCPKEGCGTNISKDQRGKYLFPETLLRLLDSGRVGPLTGFEGTRAAGDLVLQPDGEVMIELRQSGAAGDEEVSEDEGPAREEIPDGTLMGSCPRCGAPVRRDGKGYRCEKNVPRAKTKECDFRLSERIKYRYLPASEVRKLLSGEKTDELFGFVSMRGRKFKARLYYEQGELKWEFPPKAAKKPRAKGGEAPRKPRSPRRKTRDAGPQAPPA
jgi:DNA topoisomerase-3